MNSWQSLQQQTARFRSWAAAYPYGEKRSEWECDYDAWSDLYTAFQSFLEENPFDTWSDEQTGTLLYVLARDNEMGFSAGLASKIAKYPRRLLHLAATSLQCEEYDAKWQIARQLGNLHGHASEAEPLLLSLFQDADEYVRRNALMALGRLECSLVEGLVEAAWSRPDEWQEYQRMGVLDALYNIRSLQLEKYLARADEDGRQHLAGYAAKIRSASSSGS